MKTISLKLSNTLAAKLNAVAKRRNSSKSELIREALEAYLENGKATKELSAYEKAPHLAGCLGGGPTDLSYNKKHMEGYGQ